VVHAAFTDQRNALQSVLADLLTKTRMHTDGETAVTRGSTIYKRFCDAMDVANAESAQVRADNGTGYNHNLQHSRVAVLRAEYGIHAGLGS